MLPVNPLDQVLPYLAGLACGAVLRQGYPGGAYQGFLVSAGLAAVCAWSLFEPRGEMVAVRGGGPSLYGQWSGLRPVESFWCPPPRRRRLVRGALALLLLLGGTAQMWLCLGPPAPPLAELTRMFPAECGARQVTVSGTVVTDSEPVVDGWRVLLRPTGQAERAGLIQVTVGGRLPGANAKPGVRRGTRLTFPAKLYRPQAANPGETAFTGITSAGRLAALTWVPAHRVRVEPSPAAAEAVEAVVARFRSGLRRCLGRGAIPPERGILYALLLGERAEVTEQVSEDFARAGAMHLLVVSGLHLSVVAGLLGEVGARLKFGRKAQAVLAAVGAAIYATLTGWHPPVMRAALMTLSAQAAVCFGRQHDSERALWLAVLLMLLLRPLLFFDAGFRLTVAATWGVVALGPVLSKRFGAAGIVERGWCTALGAQVATIFLVLQYFGRAPLVALFASPLLVAGGAALVEAGCAAGVLGLVLPFLARPLSAGLGCGAHLLWWAAKAVGALPWATVNLSGLPEGFLVLYFGLLAAGRAHLAGENLAEATPIWLRPAVAAGLVWMLAAGGLSPWMQCTFLSVGEGDAIHLHFPGGVWGSHLLVDTGPSASRPVAYLRRCGVQGLAAVALTHLHRDHAGGISGLRQALPVGRLLVAGSGGWVAGSQAGATIEVVPGPSEGGENEASQRVAVRYGRFCLLDAGDASLTLGDPILAHLPSRQSAAGQRLFLVIKVSHHGAKTALTPEFLATWRPNAAVISVGPNAYGHPAPELLKLCRQYGTPVWRTDQAGAIRWETNGQEVRLRTFAGPAADLY